MSDLSQHAPCVPRFEWLITVTSGIILCGVTLSSAHALRSHGIIVLIVVLIAMTGITQSLVPSGRNRQKNMIPKLLLELIVCAGTSYILWYTNFLPSAFIAGAFCLTQFCMLNTRSDQRFAINGTATTMGLSALLIIPLNYLASLNFEMVVLLMCLVSLMSVLYELSFKTRALQLTTTRPVKCITAMNTLDIWVAIVLLSPSQVILYCAIRLMTFLMPAALHSFELWVMPALFLTYRQSKPSEFVQAMARVNLSLFLIAAALAVLLSTLQPTVMTQLLNISTAPTTTTYLLLAMFIPAALGQFSLAHYLLLPRRVQDIAHSAGLASAILMLVFQNSLLAHDVALAHLTYRSITSAVQCLQIIKQNGIWPGPTALFAKQIRLLG